MVLASVWLGMDGEEGRKGKKGTLRAAQGEGACSGMGEARQWGKEWREAHVVGELVAD